MKRLVASAALAVGLCVALSMASTGASSPAAVAVAADPEQPGPAYNPKVALQDGQGSEYIPLTTMVPNEPTVDKALDPTKARRPWRWGI